MKPYMSIPRVVVGKSDEYSSLEFIAFDKKDGSQIRAEFSRKQGFYKFGSRHVLLNEQHEQLGKAISLIQDNYASNLSKIFKEQRWDSVICFFEFYGSRSFAGNHHKDDDHQVLLFDVSPAKQGLIAPDPFIKLFNCVGIPTVLYQGSITDDFVESVRKSTLPGMTLEGVVCKAANPNGKKTSQPIMYKIKSEKWLGMLREFVAYDEELFQRLM